MFLNLRRRWRPD